MMYTQKEAKAARQFKTVAVLATVIFHLALFAAIGSGMLRSEDKAPSDKETVKHEIATGKGRNASIKP